jgi:hypothetical protein
MQPCPDPRGRLVIANPEHAAFRLNPRPGAPACKECAHERGVEEVDRNSVIQHAAHSDGVIAQPSAPQFSSSQAVIVAASVSPPDVSEIKLVFSIPPHRPTPNFPPSRNAAPTDSLPVVRYDGKAGERSLDLLRWGLVPFWAKDLKVGFSNINAKAEGIETRPAFREAFQRRRCLVPVDGF